MFATMSFLFASLVGQASAAPPASEEFRPADFFPIEIGNTWIWGGEGGEYSEIGRAHV